MGHGQTTFLRLGIVQEHGFGRPVALKIDEFNWRATMEDERCCYDQSS